jgi:hypothetical protein
MRLLDLMGAGLALLVCGCAGGFSSTNCIGAALNVTPAVATVDHGAQAPSNQQTFTASRTPTNVSISSSCVFSNVISAVMWSSSDPVNVQLTSDPNTSTAVAACAPGLPVPQRLR